MQRLLPSIIESDGYADTDKPREGLRGDGGVYQLEVEGGEERRECRGTHMAALFLFLYLTILLTWSYSYTSQ